MTKMTRIVSKVLGLTLVAGLLAAGAMADDHHALLVSSLIGSTPSQPIAGVASGGFPWVVSKGQATVNGNGNVNVHVEGLLLSGGPQVGTTGPVTDVAASLVCGGSGGTVVGTTATAPLTTEGNAHIKGQFTLPVAGCVAPVILVRAGATGPYIGATGLSPASTPKESDDQDSKH
jgi:hypothetical protein